MLSLQTALNAIKTEEMMNNRSPNKDEGVPVKVQKVKTPDGNWHFKIGEDPVSKEVAQELSSIIESVKQSKLKTDVFKKIK